MPTSFLSRAGILVACLHFSGGVAVASDYPSRAIKIIVPYPAGQSSDIKTRYLATKLSAKLGQPVFVENRPGAGGNIGAAAAARALPDGYTLFIGALGTLALNPAMYANPGFDAAKDFRAVAPTAIIPMVVVASKNSNVRSLQDLAALARAKPGQTNVGVTSSTSQLVVESLAANDIPLFSIRYKGSNDAMTALLGDQISVTVDTVAAARPFFDRATPIAVSSAHAMKAFPEIRSGSEQGLKAFDVVAWNAVMVPKNTPDAVVARLAAAVNEVIASPETEKKLEELGFFPPPPMESDALDAFIAREQARYKVAIDRAGIKAD